MTAKELLKKVKLIEINSRRKTNSMFVGEYHSSFRGFGMMFSEVRRYQYGDDIRKIDWNITARFTEPYVKVFEEERELISFIMVDITASMDFGTIKQLKRETVAEIAATLAHSAVKNNDKVGLILFSDKIDLFIKPQKGKYHILRVIRELLGYKPKACKSDFNVGFNFLLNTIKRKSTIFIFSDFDQADFGKSLNITSKKHNLTAIRVYDDKEVNFSDIGLAYLQDLETGEAKWIDTSSEKVKLEYAKYYKETLTAVENIFHYNNCGFLNIRTDGDYIKSLFNYFKFHSR